VRQFSRACFLVWILAATFANAGTFATDPYPDGTEISGHFLDYNSKEPNGLHMGVDILPGWEIGRAHV